MAPKIMDTIFKYDQNFPDGAGTKVDTRMFLYSLARFNNIKSAVEIGVSLGFVTEWLAAAMSVSGGKLTSVDNWSTKHGGKAWSKDPASQRLSDLGLLEYVDFVASDSIDWLKKQKDDSFEFVWVDGDHSVEGALGDIIEGWRITSDLIAVHDTENDGCGSDVREAVVTSGINGTWLKGARGIWIASKHRREL